MTFASANHAKIPSGQRPEKTVLVVEDNEQALKLFSLYLTQGGYRVFVAKTGEEALEKAAQFHPMAILLDLLLPVMDGWEVLAELKASPATHDIPVVIVSVLDRQTLGFQLGAVEYLVKPINRHHLLRTLERCLLHKRFSGKTPKVMIGHDDPSELDRLATMLTQAGFDVIQALGGAEGIHLAKVVRPDLVVIDLLLSGVDCFDVIAALRTEPETSDIPIQILTSKGLTPEQKERLSGRIQTIVIKGPEAKEALLVAITQIFQEREGPPGEG